MTAELIRPATDRLHPQVAVALLVAAISISFAALCFEKAGVHPLLAAAVRMAIALVVVAPFGLRQITRLGAREVRYGIAGGALYALHFGMWIASLGLTTVAASVTLATTTPIMLALVALGGRDAPSRRVVLAMVLSMLGVAAIGGEDFRSSHQALLGDGLALCSAAAMAAYLWLARRLGPELSLWSFSSVVLASAAIFLTLGAVALGVPLAMPSNDAIMWLALSAIVPQVAGHGLLTWALRHTTPTVVGLATTAEPAIAAVLAWLFLSEVPGLITIAGCAITVLGVLVAIAPTRK